MKLPNVRIFLVWLAVLLASSLASASFHTFKVNQIYSNADGTIQYVVLREFSGANSQNFFAGHTLTSVGTSSQTYSIPSNLPSSKTANAFVLLATQGFANLKVVTPDYIIPAGFVPTAGGSINFADVDTVTFSKLPADNVSAIDRTGAVIKNAPTNFAGQTGSIAVASNPFSATVTASGAITSQTLAATVTPSSADLGSAGCVFLAALLPGNTIFVLAPSGFVPFNQANPGAFSSGALAATSVPIIANADLSALRGISLFAGYGRGATNAACLSDMLGNGTIKAAYTIQ